MRAFGTFDDQSRRRRPSRLVAACSSGPRAGVAEHNRARRSPDKTRITFESWPINASRWSSAQAVDLDLDGRTDLLGLPGPSSKPGELILPSWARNEGKRFAVQLRFRSEPMNPAAHWGLSAVDLVGDPLPDFLMLRPGESPALARNSGNGQHWLAIRLGGYWRVKPELMRTNSHAIGTRVTLEGQGLFVPYDHTTPGLGAGPVGRAVRAGSGGSTSKPTWCTCGGPTA